MLLTVKQVADYLRVGQGHVKRLIELRELEALDLNLWFGKKQKKLRIPDQSFALFIEARTFQFHPTPRRTRKPPVVHDYFAIKPPTPEGRGRYNLQQVTEYLNLTLDEVDLLSSRGHLRVIKTGNGLGMNEKDLWLFIERCKTEDVRQMLPKGSADQASRKGKVKP